MASIEEIQDEIAEEFSSFSDWTDKYQYLIDMGKSLPPYPDEQRKDQYIIKGCSSKTLLYPYIEDGNLHFASDTNAIIAKGIVGLVLRVLSGHPPQEIIDADFNFIEKIGLREHLSPTRSNGLLAMLKQIKFYAIAFAAKAQR